MSETDKDVAAILGLSADSLEPPANKATTTAKMPVAAGSVAILLVVGVLTWGAMLSRGQRPPAFAHPPGAKVAREPGGAPIESYGGSAAPLPPASKPAHKRQAASVKASLPIGRPSSMGVRLGEEPAAPSPLRLTPSTPLNELETLRTARNFDPREVPSISRQGPDRMDPEPGKVRWVAAPSEDEVAEVYPPSALAEGLGGSVLLHCRERRDGSVHRCEIVDETPPEAGFGRAALKLSRSFLLEPFYNNGHAVEVDVELPYDFSVRD